MCGYERFTTVLDSIGNDDTERAALLETSPKTIKRYRKGLLPKVIRSLVKHPALLRALAADAEARHAAGK